MKLQTTSKSQDPRTGKKQKSKLIGHLTDATTRPAILDHLHKALDAEALDIACPHLIHELRIFQNDPDKGRPEAPEGDHDDDVLALAIGLHWIDSATPYVTERVRRRQIDGPMSPYDGPAPALSAFS